MKDQEYPVAPEAAAERMVLGRMVLRIEDSGRAVLEACSPITPFQRMRRARLSPRMKIPPRRRGFYLREADLIGGCPGGEGR